MLADPVIRPMPGLKPEPGRDKSLSESPLLAVIRNLKEVSHKAQFY